MELHQRHCVQPLEWKGVKPLTFAQAQKMMPDIPGWELDEGDMMLSKNFSFATFTEAMTFVNQVAELSEFEQHHPDIHVFYKRVQLDIWTHAIQGLHLNDFILAAKINVLL